jgi:hypothetical protein
MLRLPNPLWNTPDAGGGAAAAAPAAPPDAAAAPAAGAAAPPAAGEQAPRWWERQPEPVKAFLTAKGLTVDDPLEAVPRIVDIARNAESRIGRGLDTIMDKPKPGQKLAEWLRENAGALGLPDKPDGYKVPPPDFWPKDAKWDDEMDAQARAIAHAHGVPPEAHKAYVEAFARKIAAMDEAVTRQLQAAQANMMAELERDLGDRAPAEIALARQGAQAIAARIGLSSEAIENIGQVLAAKIGDAATIRFMAEAARLMGEDRAAALGTGGALTLTPAEARAELQKWQSPGGEWYEAVARGDRATIARLQDRYNVLLKLAAR